MTTPASRHGPRPAELRSRLAELTLHDEHRLRRRLDGTRRLRDPDRLRAALDALATEVDAAELRVAARRDSRPDVTYPAELPITGARDEIAAAIRDHQVVVVAGETGSGKTTQLPKICLDLGRGVRGMIGHTQPRRLAARTVAERIASELAVPLGDAVGYQVRFTDRASESTLVKVMTDGILLTEIQRDRQLRRYDTLIIDEAHERSLNVDFILGYVKQLLPRRPDLKVVITSATIDPARFSAHFDDAPVLEVSGRTYPVEVRYRPVPADAASNTGNTGAADQDRDQVQAVCDAVTELTAEGPGDILVFASGEREIRDTADALRRQQASVRAIDRADILPLYARLSAAEQHRVFEPHQGRRIVIATNIAETSLTVPGIRYVVDPGTARISRYSHRTKVQRLPIEAISQASANQRAGRCGRLGDGICIRLYAEEDLAGRPEFTDPEILRTNLASVILAMTDLGLGDIGAFPFLDPPDQRSVRAGVDLLTELGAFEPGAAAGGRPGRRLTPVGRTLARLPIDPRLARMIVEAGRTGCAREVVVLAAALSIQDPRERPADAEPAADAMHRRFADETSDFATYLNLWRYLREQQDELSSSRFRRMCRTEFLHYLRVREWQDLEAQLRQLVRPLGIALNSTPAAAEAIHTSVLAGLLSHIGMRDTQTRDYLGARGARFAIFPGSAVAGKPPAWVMAAELVETSRLWGRVTARIEPEWAERLGAHLVRRSYSEPHWEKKRGAVMAYEKVTLYGVPIVARRRVTYGRIDPVLSRELFIRHALVEGDWETRHPFFHENRRLVEDVVERENRSRRRDILVDDETLFAFYDERVGPDVVSAAHFDSWWKQARRERPDLLTFPTELLVNPDAAGAAAEDYPDSWRHGDLELALSYQFEPGSAADGVTVEIPLPVLNQVGPAEFSWQVPGLREELVTAWIRSLPKSLRRNFVPVPDFARAVLERIRPGSQPLRAALGNELRRLSGVPVDPDAWDPARVPPHLLVTFRVVDGGVTVGEGKDLDELKASLRPTLRATISRSASGLERSGLRSWDLGTLPDTHRERHGDQQVVGYPAVVDAGDSVRVQVLETPQAQRREMVRGTRRLLLLNVPSPLAYVQQHLTNVEKLTLSQSPHGSVPALLDDCAGCAVDRIVAAAGGPAWDDAGFAALRDRVRAELIDTVFDTVRRVAGILATARDLGTRLAGVRSPVLADAVDDLRGQLDALVYPGFVTATGWPRLTDLPRYLRAAALRLDKIADNPARDAERMQVVARMWHERERLLAALPPEGAAREAAEDLRWTIEELRVGLFAPQVRTAFPVSEQRIRREVDRLAALGSAGPEGDPLV